MKLNARQWFWMQIVKKLLDISSNYPCFNYYRYLCHRMCAIFNDIVLKYEWYNLRIWGIQIFFEWGMGEFDLVAPIGLGLTIAAFVNFSVRYFFDFENVTFKSLKQTHIWQVSSQLSCAYSCRIWTRYPIDKQCGDTCNWFSAFVSPNPEYKCE